MGGLEEDIKPILEVNPEANLVKRIEESESEELTKNLSVVLLGQALLSEGIMPKDPAEFAKALTAVV